MLSYFKRKAEQVKSYIIQLAYSSYCFVAKNQHEILCSPSSSHKLAGVDFENKHWRYANIVKSGQSVYMATPALWDVERINGRSKQNYEQ